jgi:hypothetical protein
VTESTLLSDTNAEVILKRFTYSTPETQDSRESSTSVYSGKDWLKMKTLINSVVPDPSDKRVQKIHRSLHHMAVKDNLQKTEIEGLRKAVIASKKQKKKSKTLDLQQRKEYHGGAVFWSPTKIREARFRERIKKQQEEEQQVEKAQAKAEKAQQKVLKLQEKEERERLRVKKREERERIRAEKQAAWERQRIEKENSKKTIKPSQNGKRKASKSLLENQKKKARIQVIAEVEGVEAQNPPHMITTRSGRNTNRPSKSK